MTAITPKFDFSDIETGPKVDVENIDHSESRTPHNALTPELFNEYERVMEEVCTAIGDYNFTDTVPAPSSSIATALRQTYNLKFDKTGGTITGATTLPSNNITAVQIESSTTSSAPFIVHSNTMVSGLNVQYLNGHIAPTGVIVGDSDSQTLSNKTITSSILNSGEINSPVVNNGTITNSTTNLSNGKLTLPTAAIPNQTSDGQTVWDSTNKVLTIGDSTSRRTIVNTTNTQTLTNKTLQSPVLSEGNVDLGTGVDSVLRTPRKTTEVANTDTNTGSLAWNITTNRLTVGTGSSRVSLLDSESDQSITGTKTFNSIPAFNGGTSGDSSPFTVDSTQVVANLNADQVDSCDVETYLTNSSSKIPRSDAVYSAIYRLGSTIRLEKTYTAISATNPWFCLSLPDQNWTTAHFSADFIAEMRTRKVIYDEMGASPVSSFGGEWAGHIFALTNNATNIAMITALAREYLYAGSPTTNWRLLHDGTNEFNIIAISVSARSIMVNPDSKTAAGSAIEIYRHRVYGSTTSARHFSEAGLGFYQAGGDKISGLRRLDQMQVITGSIYQDAVNVNPVLNGAFSGSSYTATWNMSGGSAASRGTTYFNSANSPQARTGAKTEIEAGTLLAYIYVGTYTA